MSAALSNLEALREARDTATLDLHHVITAIDAELAALGSTKRGELIGSLGGNVRELQLLRRREVAIIGGGTDLSPEGAA